jgi:hypothetical protein
MHNKPTHEWNVSNKMLEKDSNPGDHGLYHCVCTHQI